MGNHQFIEYVVEPFQLGCQYLLHHPIEKFSRCLFQYHLPKHVAKYGSNNKGTSGVVFQRDRVGRYLLETGLQRLQGLPHALFQLGRHGAHRQPVVQIIALHNGETTLGSRLLGKPVTETGGGKDFELLI